MKNYKIFIMVTRQMIKIRMIICESLIGIVTIKCHEAHISFIELHCDTTCLCRIALKFFSVPITLRCRPTPSKLKVKHDMCFIFFKTALFSFFNISLNIVSYSMQVGRHINGAAVTKISVPQLFLNSLHLG
jgi:hypothetical protein